MITWWTSLSTAMQVLWAVTLSASLIFVIQTIFTFLGLGGEGGIDTDFDGDLDIEGPDGSFDADPSMNLLTFRNFVNFCLGFGWTAVLMRDRITSNVLLILVAVIVGIGLVAAVMWLFKWLTGMQQSGNIDIHKSAVGCEGKVYLVIPAERSGEGKVQITINNAVREYDAVTDGATVVTDGVPYASVVAPAGTTLTPDTDYYIVVAPAALTSGYSIEFATSDGLTFSKDYTGSTYNAATFKRNNIAPVGKKNLDKFETPLEGYWRLTSQEEFGEGSYLFGYPMGDGNIRIFDESKTDCFISGGTDLVNKFSNVSLYSLLSVWNRWTAGGESPTIMRHYVMWAFRNAYVDTDSGTSVTGFTYVGDDLILNPNDKFRLPVDADNTLSMKLGYKSGGQQYKNVQLSGCTLNLDENGGGKVVGRITEQSIENLIDIFYISKGSSFTMFASKADALTAAKKACDKDTTVGFCTVEQTTNAGDKMNNMYMIQNYHICSSPAPAAIWLYKKGIKAVSYLKYKEINN